MSDISDTQTTAAVKPRAAGSLLTALGAAGACLSWLALLWIVFAEQPIGADAAVARHHLVTIAQCGLLTSLALLLVGALRRGFSALDRFFASILERTATPRAVAVAPVKAPETGVVDAGKVGGRPYRRFANGSVQVDTLLGQRLFASMEDARAFVGEGAPARRAA
jgi:hypothetical protein